MNRRDACGEAKRVWVYCVGRPYFLVVDNSEPSFALPTKAFAGTDLGAGLGFQWLRRGVALAQC